MCLTNRRNGQHYKLMHFTHARNWQQWLLGGHIVPQEAWQNCVQQKPLLHVFSVCDPHLRGCVFKNGTEDFSSHICQNSGYLLFERCGSICLPCLWPNSLGPLYTPCQLLRAFAGTEIWSLLCSLFEPVPCVERWNMNVNTLWCFEISLPIPAFQLHLKCIEGLWRDAHRGMLWSMNKRQSYQNCATGKDTARDMCASLEALEDIWH